MSTIRGSDTAKPTQTARLIEYLRTHPGATAMELVTMLAIPKYTSRISDAREQGFVIVCEKDRNGRNGYWLIEPPVQTALFFSGPA